MTGLFFHSIRNLRRRRLRSAAGAAGILLTISLLMAIQIGLDSVSVSYTDLVALQAGKADLIIRAAGGDWLHPKAFDPAEVQGKLASHRELRGLTPRWLAIVQVRSAGAERYAVMVGVEAKAERELDLWGLQPAPELAGNRCAVSRALAEHLGAKDGASLTASTDPAVGETELRLESVIERQLLLPQEWREFIVVNAATARAIAGETERVHLLAGTFKDPSSYYDSRDLHASVLRIKDAGEEIAAALGSEYEVRLPKAGAIAAYQNLASPLRAIFGVFAILALSVTALLIYSIVSVAVEERIREYGILRALGARRRDILRLVLGEAALISVIGSVPGVILGVGAAQVLLVLVGWAMGGSGGAVSLRISPSTIWLTLAAGTVLAVGGALLPALQATRWRIVDALNPLRRGQIVPAHMEEGGTKRPLLLAGIVLSALSVVIFFVLPTAFLSGNSSLIGTVVLCLLLAVLVGFTLVAVAALPLIEGAVMNAVRLCVGPAAELGRRNLERHRRRHRTTSLMFILSVAMVIFVASLVVMFSRTSMVMVEHFNGAAIRLQSDDPDAKGLKPELRGMEGVEGVSEVRYLRSRSERGTAYDVILSDVVGMKQLWIVPYGVDYDLTSVLFTEHSQWNGGGLKALESLAEYERHTTNAPSAAASPAVEEPIAPMVLSQSAASFLDVGVGDLVQLDFHLGAHRRAGRFQVEGICRALPGFQSFRSRVANAIGSGVLIPQSRFQELTREAPDEAVQVQYFLRTKTGAGVEAAVAQAIRDRFDLRFRFGVKAAGEQKRDAQMLYWTTQIFFGLLLAVAVAISVFALIASMASAAIERRWEIGMLKALGLRRKELFRMFLSEALGLTLSAGVAGGAIGFSLAWLFLLEVGTLAEVPIVFAMPYVTFAATLAISLAAAAAAAHLPTRRLLRRPAAEILRLDTV